MDIVELDPSYISGAYVSPQASSRPKHEEREVELAELETRLRSYTLELLQPTIRKTTTIEGWVEDVRTDLTKTRSTMSELQLMGCKVESQMIVVESFRQEMSTWNKERFDGQAQVAESISFMKQDINNCRYALEREDASIHSLQRTTDRVVGELQKVQEGSDRLRIYVDNKLGQNSKLLNAAKTDLEVKFIALETRHNRLSDELWGEATGLTKVTRDLQNTDEAVAFISNELRRMESEKADVSQLEGVQEEVNSLIRESNANVSTLKNTVDGMMTDVKEHFRTATNTVAAHSATMLSEVRSSYQAELDRCSTLRSDMMTFMDTTKFQIKHLEESVTKSTDQTEEQMGKAQNDIDEITKLRRRDRNNAELEHKMLQERIAGGHDSAGGVAKSLEHLSSIIWMMLQSERAASAMGMQDDTDRANVALVGYRDGNGRGTPSTAAPTPRPQSRGGASSRCSPLPSMGKAPSRAASPRDSGGGNPVISVDQRCLSCSGQAQTVLAGFKMACLQYAPGPVSFAKKTYQRGDLSELRQKLLDQANEALISGPETNPEFKKDFFAQRDQTQSSRTPKGRPPVGSAQDVHFASQDDVSSVRDSEGDQLTDRESGYLRPSSGSSGLSGSMTAVR